ncbi:peptide deformylase [Rhodocaloribacter litoris]|uniref:peptide deformylase n=1 Tax=Rhodocaloribacter litoris TaxID=2558931 RepID=UPI00141F4625|nr:peptide deformylase [Rhodocaloribacter litoris]QXD15505.1 peptide deformylase [Rhodocaloribacter litoris]
MILPIYTYGQPILREQTEDVTENSEALQQLIDDMIETMHNAAGIGLAAPQVGRRERLFVADLSALADDLAEQGETVPDGPQVFINPEILEETEEETDFEEGCLSIPDLREVVWRPKGIRLRFLDRNFRPREMQVDGMLARVIQHEYDHLEGILFIDHISPFRRRLLRRRLQEMARGQVEADYPILPPNGSGDAR